MPENKQNDLKNYSVPKALRRKTIDQTIEKTLGQIAHAQLMSDFYREKAVAEADPKEGAKYDKQADQLEAGQKLNIEFLDWIKDNK